MTVRQALDYCAAFRSRWNVDTERALLDQFRLDERQKTTHLSKGQRTQLALIAAICPEPESAGARRANLGTDPIVRREFIRTVIGAYQEGDPGRRTVFVSTHLISEFEGLIDEFTIIDRGREVLSLDADTARERYLKIYARFAAEYRISRCRAFDPSGGTAGRSRWSPPAIRTRCSISCGRAAGGRPQRSPDARRDLRLDAPA